MLEFSLSPVHSSWHQAIHDGLAKMNQAYLQKLKTSSDWLPGPQQIFNAFSLPIDHINFVLFGESPYPRVESANGYAFWDAAVGELWSQVGLSKKVNRATSMRNILKMLLAAEDLLDKNNPSQEAIARLDKRHLAKTNHEFFNNLLNRGFLLLNATLVLQKDSKPQKDAKEWQPFMQHILHTLLQKRPQVKLILFGRIANPIEQMVVNFKDITKLNAEHPYNLSFVSNPEVIDFFKPLHLLKANNEA